MTFDPPEGKAEGRSKVIRTWNYCTEGGPRARGESLAPGNEAKARRRVRVCTLASVPGMRIMKTRT